MLNLIPLFSSSKGNCTYVYSDTVKILIDIGISTKRLVEKLSDLNVKPEEIQAVLVTHEHSDHIKGIKLFANKYNIPVFASKKTWQTLSCLDLKPTLINAFLPEESFKINDLEVYPFSIPHDAIDPCGFSLTSGMSKITVATDIGHMTSNILEHLESSDTVLLESNHDIDMLRSGNYPYYLKQRIIGNNGHMSNALSAETVEYLIKKGTKNFILAHLSQENNFPDLALETVRSRLKTSNIDLSEISITVAQP